MPSVDIRNLGIVEYTDALEVMSTLQQQRINNEIPDTILFLEHPEIVTVGPRARNDGIAPPSDYKSHPVDRGGGLTWHGPGQLVVYPIIHWNKDDEKSVADIISKIESWVIAALDSLGIQGYRDERMQGVWVDNKKICSIGLSFGGLVAMDLRSTTTRLKAELRTSQDVDWTNRQPPPSMHSGTQRLVRTLRRLYIKACRIHCNAELKC